MAALTIALRVTAVCEQLPDAETDVLIFDASHPEAQLGALIGHDADGPHWVNAEGRSVRRIAYWAHMPRLPLQMESA